MKVQVLKVPVTDHMKHPSGPISFKNVDDFITEEFIPNEISVFSEETEIKNHPE
jgi:hypothetical protein